MITSCTFDLECSSLNANFGIILCGVIKPADGDPIIFRADELNKRWKTQRSDDSSVVKAVVDELMKYDILVAHNGAKFDIPYLRTRMAKWGLGMFPNKKLVDPVQIARNRFKLSSNSLDSMADFLDTSTKTRVSGDMWLRASLDGDKEAMDYVVEHCVADVLMLERLVDIVKPYCTVFNDRGSSW